MISFTNFLILLCAIAFVKANSIGSVVPPSSGWTDSLSPSPPPSINVTLNADVLLTTLGFTGGSTASQQVEENVSGSSEVPAVLTSSSGSSATASNSGTIESVIVVQVPEENVSTLNAVDTEFLTAGVEEVSAALHGVNASVEYAGESSVPLGGGVTLVDASTEVEVVSADEE